MQKNKKGFFIIEVVLYIAISIFIINLLYSAIVHFNRAVRNEYRGFLSEASLISLVSIFNEDVVQASSNLSDWATGDNQIIFSSGDGLVTWLFRKNTLYRKESRSRASVLLKNIESATFDILKDGELVEGVSLKMVLKSGKIYRFNFGLINGKY